MPSVPPSHFSSFPNMSKDWAEASMSNLNIALLLPIINEDTAKTETGIPAYKNGCFAGHNPYFACAHWAFLKLIPNQGASDTPVVVCGLGRLLFFWIFHKFYFDLEGKEIAFAFEKDKHDLYEFCPSLFRASVQQHLKEIGGILLRRKICGKRKFVLRKNISVKTRQLLLAANR